MRSTCQELFMDEMNYSIEAEEAKAVLYGKNFMVFVEGIDDTLFWQPLFALANMDVQFEDVGGGDIKKKIDQIVEENADFVVACDSDHSEFMFEENQSHSRVIRTYGYSIENSMYNPKVITHIVNKYCRSKVVRLEEVMIAMNAFTDSCRQLIVYDICNHRNGIGVSVCGDSCIRLLESNSSHAISSKKIDQFISSIESNFPDTALEECDELLSKSNKDLWFHIKGHFLTHFIINLIRNKCNDAIGKAVGINMDSLYALTVDSPGLYQDGTDVMAMLQAIENLSFDHT